MRPIVAYLAVAVFLSSESLSYNDAPIASPRPLLFFAEQPNPGQVESSSADTEPGAEGPDGGVQVTVQEPPIQPLGVAPQLNLSAAQVTDTLHEIVASAAGNVLIVDCHGNYDHDTVQGAIDAATDGDVIVVLPNTCTELGHYFENINFLGKAISVQSLLPGSPAVVDATVINGTQSGRVVTFNNAEGPHSLLDGLTITNGSGGILCEGTSPIIRNCFITANSAFFSRGGGAYAQLGASPQFLSCRLTNNYANTGGAIQFTAFPPTGELLVSNSLIANNSAPTHGGGLYAVGQVQITLRNCTIVGNTSGVRGGGMMVSVISVSAYPQIIENCIIAQNTAPIGPDIHYTGSAPMTLTYSDMPGGLSNVTGGGYFIWGTGNIMADPVLTMNYHLHKSSPCRDAGDPSVKLDSLELDIDGEPRLQHCRVDMGADESPFFLDCNGTSVPDACEVLDGSAADANSNFRPDECEKEIYVDCTNCPGPGSGTGDDPFCSIQAGIDATLIGDQVVVASSVGCEGGAYFETINFLGKAITIRSTAPHDPQTVADTIVDGRNFDSSVVMFEYGETTTSVLDGLTITGGSGTDFESMNDWPNEGILVPTGGGIFCRGAGPLIRRCIIRDNHAGYGGGVATVRSAAEIVECTIMRNVASGFAAPSGGGACPSYFPRGAGVYSRGGAPKFSTCRISHNRASNDLCRSSIITASGGGVLLHANEGFPPGEKFITAEVSGCEIRDNSVIVAEDGLDSTAALGGGLMAAMAPGSTLVLTNSMILDNSADFGGGVYLVGGTSSMNGCSIAGNSADGSWAGGVELGSGQFELRDTIIFANTIPNVGDSFAGLASVSYSNIQLPGTSVEDGAGNINADPSFVNAAAGNYHLRPDSPCIETGDPLFLPDVGDTDIDGDPRILGRRVDMGADEFNADCNANGVLDLDDISKGTSSDCNSNRIPDDCTVVEPDCNANSVPDDCDITALASEDCTANGIPDECEEDCNANGQADSCDLADGTSADCDGDGLPNECDFSGPAITEQPVSQEVLEGQKVSFQVAVEGDNSTKSVGYSWQKDGVGLVYQSGHLYGVYTSELTIVAVVPSDAGVYHCLVVNPDGCTESAGALLTVIHSCPADLDGGEAVDATDLAVLLDAWGPNPGRPADFNGDGVIDAYDLAFLLAAWGPCPK